MRRRELLTRAGLATLPLLPCAATAQTKPIRLIVPFPPAGATDVTARIVSEPLAKELGQTIIVENRAGAGGSIGMAEVARAAPDGLTLGMATLSTHGVNPAVYKKLPYDAVKDFTPVAELVKAPGVLVVSSQLGIENLAAFLTLLKRQPGKLTYASPGNGSIGHMWGEIFKRATGSDLLHVPYRGAAPAVNDLIAGVVNASFDQVASALPHIRSGRLVALAVSWPKRLAVLPDVPTYAEVKLPSANLPSWFGLVAPAGLAEADVGRIHAAVNKTLQLPTVRKQLDDLGLFPSDLDTPARFARQIREEVERMREISRIANIELG